MSGWLWSEVRLFRSRGSQAIIPTVLALAVSGLAVTLVLVVIARSPYTQGNITSKGYDRTSIVYVGEDQPVDPHSLTGASPADPALRGKALFIGCAGCHGLRGEGATVAPVIIGTGADELSRNTHQPAAGMPTFTGLTDEDLQALAAYLKGASK